MRAEPAADFADFDADFDRRVLLAADAAFERVTFVFPRCANVEPAADLADLDADFDLSVLLAAEAALREVRSFLAAILNLQCPRLWDQYGLHEEPRNPQRPVSN